MYSDFSASKVPVWKVAQWGHVMEAYSTTVTGAFGSPRTTSGSGSAAVVASGAGA